MLHKNIWPAWTFGLPWSSWVRMGGRRPPLVREDVVKARRSGDPPQKLGTIRIDPQDASEVWPDKVTANSRTFRIAPRYQAGPDRRAHRLCQSAFVPAPFSRQRSLAAPACSKKELLQSAT